MKKDTTQQIKDKIDFEIEFGKYPIDKGEHEKDLWWFNAGFIRGRKQALEEVEKLIDRVLGTERNNIDMQMTDELSIAQCHTTCNKIETELKSKIRELEK